MQEGGMMRRGAGRTCGWSGRVEAMAVLCRWNAAASINGSFFGRPCVWRMDLRITYSSSGSCRRSTQWMQLTGQMDAASSMRSSLSPHCVTARAFPYFISI